MDYDFSKRTRMNSCNGASVRSCMRGAGAQNEQMVPESDYPGSIHRNKIKFNYVVHFTCNGCMINAILR